MWLTAEFLDSKWNSNTPTIVYKINRWLVNAAQK